jgi:Carboxypeptidase regulatory-like domain
MARLILSLSAAMLAVLLAVPLSGKEVGTLTGVVEDPSGAAIPGVHIKLASQATPVEFKTESDAKGHFEFSSLSKGQYILSADSQGVEPAETVVNIGALPAPLLHIQMKIARVKQVVTVKSGPFSSPSSEDNTNVIDIDQSTLQDLPTKYYSILNIPMLFLDNAALGTGTGKPQLIVDGVPMDDVDVPAVSIRRMTVNKSPYSAEYQRPGKGSIHITLEHHLKQHFHGSLMTALQDANVDARDPFSSSNPPERRILSEAKLEGPITHNIRFLLSGRYDYHNMREVVNALTPEGPVVQNAILPERNSYLFGRLSFMRTKAGNIGIAYKYDNLSLGNQGVGGLVLPQHGYNSYFHQNDVRINDVKDWHNFINQLLLGYGQWSEDLSDASHSPSLIVLGAFEGGGAQATRREQNTVADMEDVASWTIGKHTLQFGGGVRPRYVTMLNGENFGGTFTFSTLSDFAAGLPSLYSVNIGQPQISFNQYKNYAFVQDEFRFRPNLSLFAGLRREWQSNVSYGKAFAPRVAIAYAPGRGHTMLRAGFGVFYETQPATMEEDNLLYNGVRIRELDVVNPSYPTPFPAGVLPPTITPSVIRIAPNVRFPYLMQSSVSIERQIGKGENFLTVEYANIRGVGLYRERNLNAPLPGTTVPLDPNFVNFDQYETSALSRSNGLEVTFRSRAIRGLNVLAQYRLEKTMSDTGGYNVLPANNYDLHTEWGRSNHDRLHQFTFLGTYTMPWSFRVGAIFGVHSGIPYDISTGYDTNNDTVFNDRPPGVTRNTGQGPGFANLDLRCSREFILGGRKGEERRLEIGVDAFDAFNHPNFMNYVGDLSSPLFGHPVEAEPTRQLQFTIRLHF